MPMREWLFKVPDDELLEEAGNLVDIPFLLLSEFEKREIAVEIYSELLKCNIWLCSDEDMADQIKMDSPGAVCYTTHELRDIIKLNPSPESLKKINEAKGTFPGSSIISTENKNHRYERVQRDR